MDLGVAWARARRGFREEGRLYLVAMSSLAVAFFCLGSVMIATTNLTRLSEHWGEHRRITVFLREGVTDGEVAQLRVLLDGLSDVAQVQHIGSDDARRIFLEGSDLSDELAALPTEIFPPSLELDLVAGIADERAETLAVRLGALAAVSDVETYRSLFNQLEAMIGAAHNLSIGLGVLVTLCVLAVVGNTIRLAVARRSGEIEVMKLCGATDSFIRGPFIIEGSLQGAIGALVAVLLLGLGFVFFRSGLDQGFRTLVGFGVSFLGPLQLLSLVAGGALVGAIGSLLSVRRYLTV